MSNSVISISTFVLYQIPFYQIPLYQIPLYQIPIPLYQIRYIRFRYIKFRYIKFTAARAPPQCSAVADHEKANCGQLTHNNRWQEFLGSGRQSS